MKRFTTVVACLSVIVLGASPVPAQHQHEAGAAQPAPAPQQQAPPPAGQGEMACKAMMAQMGQGMPGMGPMSPGMMGQMGMMCPMCARMMAAGPHSSMMQSMMQMMGGQTDPASIGMTEAMGAGNMDTKMMGHMLQMRGEMLRAIGEIMIKHGTAIEEEK